MQDTNLYCDTEILELAACPEITAAYWRRFLETKRLGPTGIKSPHIDPPSRNFANPEDFLGEFAVRESWVPKSLKASETKIHLDDLRPKEVPQAEASCFPYSTVGKLLSTFATPNGIQAFEGTGFVVHTKGETAIITAAHCLFSGHDVDLPRQWAQNVVFIPTFAGNTWNVSDFLRSPNFYIAREQLVLRRWVEAEFMNPYEYDVGAILLDGRQSRLLELTGALGWIAGDFPPDRYSACQAIGYPTGEEFYHQCLWKTNVNLSYQKCVTGVPHIRMKSNLFRQGASGGPIIVSSNARDHYAIGLNSSLSNYGPDFVYWDSPRFGRAFNSLIRRIEGRGPGTKSPSNS